MPRKPKAEFEITAEDKASRILRNIETRMGGLGGAARGAGVALAGVVGARGVGDIVRTADQYTRLQSRIEFLTRETGNFDQVYAGLLSTVTETGGALETSIDIFQSLDRVRNELNLTDDQILQLNSNLLKLGAIGNTGTQALNDGLRQLNQSFAGGVVRAEEFNSLLDNTPEIAAAIARGFDKTQGQLRLMVNEGKVFSGDVAKVLLDQTDEINEKFEEVPTNLDRAFGILKTSIGTASSSIDDATGITRSMAEAIERAARGIRLATGNASGLEVLRSRLVESQQELRGLERIARQDLGPTMETIRSLLGNPVGEELEQRIQVLREKVAGLRTEIEKVRDTSVDGEDVGGETGEKQAAAAQKAFELRVAQLEGFATVAEKKQAERLDKELAAELRGQARIFEQKLAQEEGFSSAREKALADQAAKFQQDRADREQEARDALFQTELAQLRGFGSVAEEEAAARDLERFDAEIQRRITQHQELTALELGFKSSLDQQIHELELELEETRFAEKLERRAAQFEEELALELGYVSSRDQQLAEQEERHQENLIKARTRGNAQAQQAALFIAKFEKQTALGKTQSLLGLTQQLTAGMAQESEKAFKIHKSAAIGSAIISTAQGVADALASGIPFPGNLIAAGIVAAAGAAQISTIQSQQYQGGGGSYGGGVGGTGGAGGGYGGAESPLREIPVFESQERSNQRIELVIRGDGEIGQAVARSIETDIAEGDIVIIPDGSRQAQDLDSRL